MKRFLVIFMGLAILSDPALARPITCSLPKAPSIRISPRTAEIVYDYSLNSRELARKKTGTVNPFGRGVDTATGGLREDRPTERIRVAWGSGTYRPQDVSCLWFDEITVEIDLKPHIYIANDGLFTGKLCHQAIREHELKHVAVDRELMNIYARRLGGALRKAVDESGVIGPFPADQLQDMQRGMQNTVTEIVHHLGKQREAEMSMRQGQVDSLKEYQRVSDICNAARQ